MSFLSELQKQKETLKVTDTIVTNVDGQRFLEKGGKVEIAALPPTYGFVVDTKPDNIPALIINHLYIGSQDCCATNILQAYDIRHVLSLGINIESCEVDHKFVEVLDLPETDINPIISEALPYIHNAVTHCENILVHCNAGVSRTSMVAIAYLMMKKHLSYNTAYSLVKEKRPAIRPNDGFNKQLLSLYVKMRE